jgi:hypothetical protein
MNSHGEKGKQNPISFSGRVIVLLLLLVRTSSSNRETRELGMIADLKTVNAVEVDNSMSLNLELEMDP